MDCCSDKERTYATIVMSVRPARPKDGVGHQTNCYNCAHAREVPGNAHILCAKPCPNVTGHPTGIKGGWFMYPYLFDPTWSTTACSTFEPKQSDHPSASQSAKLEQ